MRWDTQTTICAIATGTAAATRGAIRIAGPDTVAILSAILSSIGSSRFESKNATRSTVSFPLGEPFGNLDIDVWLWPTHRSYTGSPAAELHMVGNQILLNRVLSILANHGARIAEPGEFTLRAFLSGRMDLTQCEAVLGAINATNDRQFEVALHQLAGGLSQPLRNVRTSLIELLADLEAGLDFVDEDISFISSDEVITRIAESHKAIQVLVDQLSQRGSSREVIGVVLTGSPNAGKSSLLNAMTGNTTAIVHSQAGTTRDYLKTELKRNGRSIDLVDTAGVPGSGLSNPEPMTLATDVDGLAGGMTASQREAARLLLYCVDSTLDEALLCIEVDSYLKLRCDHADTWLVWTKCESLERPAANVDLPETTRVFETSSRDAVGLGELIDAIFNWHDSEAAESSMVVGATAIRCQASLQEALSALTNARLALDHGGDEIVAGELRLALEAIGSVAGEVYTDDILDALFSRFCIGK
ncbi:MAG: 50S ribosome-binding GTPase [Planctomycetota bacterium]|nr:50S ribosome-binding GTPase [Planctomycetota bacterium]